MAVADAKWVWHLGGYYTPEWVDRLLFPENWSSLEHLDPALLRDLRVGDTIPGGAPGCFTGTRAQAAAGVRIVDSETPTP